MNSNLDAELSETIGKRRANRKIIETANFLKDYENKQSEEDTTQERTRSETNKTRKKNESPAKKRGMPIVATLAVGSATKKEKEFSSTRKPPIYEGKK